MIEIGDMRKPEEFRRRVLQKHQRDRDPEYAKQLRTIRRKKIHDVPRFVGRP